MTVSPGEVALNILETIPLVMRSMRKEMRQNRIADLNVPQFRALAFLKRSPGTSLNSLTEHLGLTAASTSKLIDGLVERKLVEREHSTEDRRRITLTLTQEGIAAWKESYQRTQASFAKRLEALSEGERVALQEAMRLLYRIFEEEQNKRS